MQHQQQQQQPTLTDVRIRSIDDVHRIFFAVHQGILPIITRRLDVRERQALVSGNLYVFEDRGQHAVTGIGIERFTEGRHWSASRVRDASLSPRLLQFHLSHVWFAGVSILLREVEAP